MALVFSTTVRNAEMNEITAAVDSVAVAGLVLIYDGARPATGGTATTLLAELTMIDPSFGASASGKITANLPIGDTSADADGTATWFRITTSTGTFVADGSVGTSGSDLNLNTTAIVTGVAVDITSMEFTAGNA
jgi:hypothetical protein